MSPTGGSCVVSPSEGLVIKTQFQVSCTSWTDEDRPLGYEFFFSHPVHGPMLLFYGWMPDSAGLFLPPGLKENDFNVDLFVKISDVLGSYRIVPLPVKVGYFTIARFKGGCMFTIITRKEKIFHQLILSLQRSKVAID